MRSVAVSESPEQGRSRVAPEEVGWSVPPREAPGPTGVCGVRVLHGSLKRLNECFSSANIQDGESNDGESGISSDPSVTSAGGAVRAKYEDLCTVFPPQPVTGRSSAGCLERDCLQTDSVSLKNFPTPLIKQTHYRELPFHQHCSGEMGSLLIKMADGYLLL